uniref:PhoH-like protein n=1 Tax=viral metagenome TaxID=1070528 RepID=A0A6C0KVQ5_9ZZZZ
MKKDNSIELKSLSNFYKAKNANQEKYFKYLNDVNNKVIFAIGPAGTGKTALACNVAISDLKNGKFKRIVITRPVVSVEEEIGFLPGSLNKKMDPWVRPIIDIFLEFYSQKDIDTMFYNNIIEISPLGFMRGRTFKNSFIIADEMQNSSPNQMMMLTTRIGSGSKMVITGDLKQTDKVTTNSGLFDIINKYRIYDKEQSIKYNNTYINHGIKVIEFEKSDIERDPIISKLLDIYEIGKANVDEPKTLVDIKEKDKGLIDNDCAIIPKKNMKNNWELI